MDRSSACDSMYSYMKNVDNGTILYELKQRLPDNSKLYINGVENNCFINISYYLPTSDNTFNRERQSRRKPQNVNMSTPFRNQLSKRDLQINSRSNNNPSVSDQFTKNNLNAQIQPIIVKSKETIKVKNNRNKRVFLTTLPKDSSSILYHYSNDISRSKKTFCLK
ncbi:hypothetical protein GJ496_010201, partial [Pomphorhynchus laevis]